MCRHAHRWPLRTPAPSVELVNSVSGTSLDSAIQNGLFAEYMSAAVRDADARSVKVPNGSDGSTVRGAAES
jgi:hypothetical protein